MPASLVGNSSHGTDHDQSAESDHGRTIVPVDGTDFTEESEEFSSGCCRKRRNESRFLVRARYQSRDQRSGVAFRMGVRQGSEADEGDIMDLNFGLRQNSLPAWL